MELAPGFLMLRDGSKSHELKEDGRRIGEYCCFAIDTGNHDSGSMLIEYDNGLHVVYSQNFIVRSGAGKRGARIIGYDGTLEFDWNTSTVTVYDHFNNTTDIKVLAKTDGHGGGDELLSDDFISVMKGGYFKCRIVSCCTQICGK